MASTPGADQQFRTDHELAAERDRFARVLEGLATAVFVTDADGVIVDANPAAARISGFERVDDMLRVNTREILGRYLMLDVDGGLLHNDELPSRQVALGQSAHG